MKDKVNGKLLEKVLDVMLNCCSPDFQKSFSKTLLELANCAHETGTRLDQAFISLLSSLFFNEG